MTKKDITEINKMHKLHHKWVDEMEGAENYLDLMNRMDTFLNFNKDASVIGVDDSYHSNSDILVIPHKNEKEYMGLTCWYIPQCSGEAPISFFLYPGHLDNMIKVLQKYQEEIKKHREKNNE